MEFDIEKLKLKTTSQLDDNEKQYLIDNVDKLNDEDREAYSDFLIADDIPNTDENTITQETTGEENQPTDQAGEDTGDGGQNNNEPQKEYVFESEEDAKNFVLKVQQEQEAAKKAAIDAATTPAEKKYVEENWVPDDWNVALKKAVEIAKKEIREEDAAVVKKQEDNAKRLENEWQDLRKLHNLPERNTDEGRQIHDGIVTLGIKHGKTNFKDAYDLWSIVPKDKGGGYDPVAAVQEAKKAESKQKISAQKKVASKLGGQAPETSVKSANGGNLETPDYNTLHNAKSVGDLLRKTGVIS